jgi:hypothetical protein
MLLLCLPYYYLLFVCNSINTVDYDTDNDNANAMPRQLHHNEAGGRETFVSLASGNELLLSIFLNFKV